MNQGICCFWCAQVFPQGVPSHFSERTTRKLQFFVRHLLEASNTFQSVQSRTFQSFLELHRTFCHILVAFETIQIFVKALLTTVSRISEQVWRPPVLTCAQVFLQGVPNHKRDHTKKINQQKVQTPCKFVLKIEIFLVRASISTGCP